MWTRDGFVEFLSYDKISKINPGAYIFQRPLFEGLMYGGKFVFENRVGLYLKGNLRLKNDYASL